MIELTLAVGNNPFSIIQTPKELDKIALATMVVMNACSTMSSLSLLPPCLLVLTSNLTAFTPSYLQQTNQRNLIVGGGLDDHVATTSSCRRTSVVLYAGGFEWEDPTESFDQGVENPFKNPDLMNSEEGMKIDPARLLGPRLNGANLYFVGMMGCGKSAVGDIVARREFQKR